MTTFTPAPVLIVPGYHGSAEAHWQVWLQRQWPHSRLLTSVDWEKPVLATWAEQIRDEIARAREPLWIVAHSFGCLASVVAAADRPQSVAALVLVAPAEPARFNLLGLGSADDRRLEVHTLADVLPDTALNVPGLVLASSNDPWMSLAAAEVWARRWQLELQDVGALGHINVDSGHGPWPDLLHRVSDWQARQGAATGVIPGIAHRMPRGRGSLLSQVRRHTRRQLDILSLSV